MRKRTNFSTQLSIWQAQTQFARCHALRRSLKTPAGASATYICRKICKNAEKYVKTAAFY